MVGVALGVHCRRRAFSTTKISPQCVGLGSVERYHSATKARPESHQPFIANQGPPTCTTTTTTRRRKRCGGVGGMGSTVVDHPFPLGVRRVLRAFTPPSHIVYSQQLPPRGIRSVWLSPLSRVKLFSTSPRTRIGRWTYEATTDGRHTHEKTRLCRRMVAAHLDAALDAVAAAGRSSSRRGGAGKKCTFFSEKTLSLCPLLSLPPTPPRG